MDPARFVAQNDVAALDKCFPSNSDLILTGRNFKLPYPEYPSVFGDQLQFILPRDSLSLLHIAAFYDNLEIFCYLLRQDPNKLGLTSMSGGSYWPLHYACFGGALEVAAFILNRAPELAEKESDSPWQAVFLATFNGSDQILELLFASERKPNLRSPKNVANQPFGQAIKGNHLKCLLILLENSCRTDVGSGMSALMQAVSLKMWKALDPLLDLGLDPNFVSVYGDSALSLACVQGHLEAVRVLCNRMEDIEIPPANGHSSIVRHAITSGKIDILSLILAKSCDINRYDRMDEQPIDAVCGLTDDKVAFDMFMMLVEAGYDIHSRNRRTQKAILDRLVLFPVGSGLVSIIRYLLEHGADPRYAYPFPSDKGSTTRSTLELVKSWINDKSKNKYVNETQRRYIEIFKEKFPDEFES
jgi:ankyrin repeat protein